MSAHLASLLFCAIPREHTDADQSGSGRDVSLNQPLNRMEAWSGLKSAVRAYAKEPSTRNEEDVRLVCQTIRQLKATRIGVARTKSLRPGESRRVT